MLQLEAIEHLKELRQRDDFERGRQHRPQLVALVEYPLVMRDEIRASGFRRFRKMRRVCSMLIRTRVALQHGGDAAAFVVLRLDQARPKD